YSYNVGTLKAKARVATLEQVNAWINMHQTIRVIQGRLEERLRSETDLSWAEFETLMRLKTAAGQPLHMGEIAYQLVGSPSGTTRIADRLENAGLIERETPRENRRVVLVKLTEKGNRVLAKADRLFRESLHETFAAHLTDREVGAVRQAMRKLLEGNDAWQEARCSPASPPASS
ncbi:MAG TPA: MarR family transcriptional regulator, partial [Candidatus Dormibacteraeota bacterium]|nr:MarR family transcriptional regulator [Candidatus Dormibacteraeota bacterium]